jgi:hypothetical protein
MLDTTDRSALLRPALDQADRNDRYARYTLIAAALVEALLLGTTLLVIDFHDRTHRLMFLLAMLTYLTLALGLIALGARVSAANARVLRALQLLDDRRTA